jgi:tellurite resistance protein TerB
MFGNLFKAKAKEAVNKFSGNKDFLEAMCAASALVAAADGTIADAEVDAAINSIKANAAIAAGFSSQEIESTFGKMSTKVNTRVGRSQLKTEIQESINRDKTGSLGMAIVLGALDVADNGGIDDKEMVVLRDIAGLCNQNLDKLLAA